MPNNPNIIHHVPRIEIGADTQNGNTWVLRVIREKVEAGKTVYQEGQVTIISLSGRTTLEFITATNGPGTIFEMFSRSGQIF